MIDKYKMKLEDNVLCAKRVLVDSVYKSANLEGIAVTFAETNDILNDVNVEKLKPSEISKVCCLRDGWQYILQNISKPLDLGYMENLHELIAKGDLSHYDLGKIRVDSVLISGTSWRPEIPNPEQLHVELQEHLKIPNDTERAVTIMLWMMRKQIFKDGNKRMATLIANKILIEHGRGILSIPVELDGKFKEKLVRYYETDEMSELKDWIYEHCLDGTSYSEEYQELLEKEETDEEKDDR